jgi:hypothetical protein
VWPNTPVGQACFLVQRVFFVGPKQQGFVGWPLFNRIAHPVLSTLLSVPRSSSSSLGRSSLCSGLLSSCHGRLALILDELGEPSDPRRAWFIG